MAGSDHALTFSSCVMGDAHDGILTVTFANPPVNALSAAVRSGLMAAAAHAAGSPAITAVVLTGAGQTFAGGADIREFGQVPADPSLPQIVEALENLGKPVVAAINGVALGGGLELALACHYRIAVAAAKIGLPEVKLGLVPGAGGTQRLPRLTGLEAAAGIIISGRMIKAIEAKDLGIIDAVAAADLIPQAISAARALIGQPLRRTGILEVPGPRDMPASPDITKLITKAKGQKAPAEALRLVALAATIPLAEGLAAERASFEMLRQSPESAALRHVFFAERTAAKVPDLNGIVPRKVETIAIIGLGLMGSGIALAALAAGYRVIGAEQSGDAAARGQTRIEALLAQNVKAGRLTEAGLGEHLSRLTIAATLDAIAPCDLVIEAVFDDLNVKRDLFRQLEATVPANTILATNTSYLNPDEIADGLAVPARFLGLHFFSPAHIMRLVEIVRCEKTASEVLATGLAVTRKLGKLPVVTGVCEGFIGNRIFSAYRQAAEFLLEDGALPQEIDAAIEQFGMAMGPFAISDLAGLEIAWARRKRHAATRDPSARYVEIADRLCEAGRFGQKNGRGWYRYDNGKRLTDPEVTELIEKTRAAKGLEPRPVLAQEIVERLLGAMAAEGTRLLNEGIATRGSDIDLVMIHGYGFPAHKGGPMFLRAIPDAR